MGSLVGSIKEAVMPWGGWELGHDVHAAVSAKVSVNQPCWALRSSDDAAVRAAAQLKCGVAFKPIPSADQFQVKRLISADKFPKKGGR